jgi:hypothetical protein
MLGSSHKRLENWQNFQASFWTENYGVFKLGENQIENLTGGS